MAAFVSENYLSRSFTLGKSAARELVYDIHNAADEDEAKVALAAAAAPTYQGLVLDSLSADPVGAKLWKGYARYAKFEGDDEYTFDTGGGTRKVTQSLATIGSYAPTGMTAPDFQGAIGVTDDKVEGVDVPAPKYQWTESHSFDDSAITTAYKLMLARMTGGVNDADFKGFASGEAMLMGVSGAKRGDERWKLTFRFEASRNATGLSVGDITGIAKQGWDYLWVRYEDYEDGTAYSIVKRPRAAYVERVALRFDFADLGIGV